MSQINFNSNEFTSLSEEVKKAMKNAVGSFADANPVPFGSDNRIAAEITESKYSITEVMKAQSYDVFYNSGGSKAEIDIINWSVLFLGVEIVITSAFEDEAKLNYLRHLVDSGKIELYLLKTSEFGLIDLDDLKTVLEAKSSNALISLSHANRYTGVLLPVKDIASMAKNNHLYFHLNASLTIGKYAINLNKIEVDFLTFDTSLINGPISVGVLFVNKYLSVSNSLYRNMVEAMQSIENKSAVLVVGMKIALQNAFQNVNDRQNKISELKIYFVEQLHQKLGLKTVDTSLKKKGLFNQLAFFVSEEEFGKYIIEKLDLNGFLVANKKYPVKINGFVDSHYINISLSEQITQKQVDAFLRFMQNSRK